MIVWDWALFFAYICALGFCKTRTAVIGAAVFVLANAYLYSPLYDIADAWANHFVVATIYFAFSALCWWLTHSGKTAIALLSVSMVNVVASFDYVFYRYEQTIVSDNWLLLIISAHALVLFSIFKGRKDGIRQGARNNSANIVSDPDSQAVYKH